MIDEKTREESLNTSSAVDSESPYDRLRTLLLGKDYESALKKQLNESDVERVADVLTEAFRRRGEKDSSMSQELSPIIESAIDTSIKQNPSRITNVIFPIMGPAVRKAVASALSDMVRSLNHLLQQSITAKALVWRFKAWRAGISYPRYVILQTLVFRVEQVFFIHKETGLLLESASAAGIEYQDPDLVSSMLTAINDFVSDSFETENDAVSTVQFGELNLIIESGPDAILALAVRGTVLSDLKETAQRLIENLHVRYFDNFQSFNGDISQFSDCKTLLAEALVEKKKVEDKKKPWLAIIALTILSGLTAYLYFESYKRDQLMQSFIEKIRSEIGYQLVDYKFDKNQISASIIRSPTSPTVEQFISNNKPEDFRVKINTTLGLIQDPKLFLPLISEKYGVKMDLITQDNSRVLQVKGKLTGLQLEALKTDQLVLSLSSNIDTSQLVLFSEPTELEQNRTKVKEIIRDLHNQALYFEVASTSLTQESKTLLGEQISQLKDLVSLSSRSGIQILQISIVGFADNQGQRNDNLKLSEDRAKFIADNFIANQLNKDLIVTWGSGVKDSEKLPSEIQRRVEIRILYQSSEAAQ